MNEKKAPIADPQSQSGGPALWPLVVFLLLLPLAFWAGFFKARGFDQVAPVEVKAPRSLPRKP